MTIENLIKAYDIVDCGNGNLRVFNVAKAKRDNVVAELKERKNEILDYFRAEKEKVIARDKKIQEIPGLEELQKAIYEQERYAHDFEKMMEDENNDGACPPTRPTSDVTALKAKYPRAASFLMMNDWATSSNYEKGTIGQKAIERIIDGDDVETVLNDAKAEWHNAVLNSIYND